LTYLEEEVISKGQWLLSKLAIISIAKALSKPHSKVLSSRFPNHHSPTNSNHILSSR
jgi:hypothetical protein